MIFPELVMIFHECLLIIQPISLQNSILGPSKRPKFKDGTVHSKLPENVLTSWKIRKRVLDVITQGAALLMEFAYGQAVERLPPYTSERSDTERSLRNLRAGAAGEQKVIEAVRSVALPEHTELVQNVTLSLLGGVRFQMDLALLSKSGILLIECKQIGGRLKFHTGPAELRKVDEDGRILSVYDCPVAQLSDQQENLLQWLRIAGFRTPVYGAVVFANNPIIEEIGEGMPVFKLRETRNLVRRHVERKPVVHENEVNRIAAAMIESSIPYLPFPLQIAEPSQFVTNPICSICNNVLSKRSERKWECAKCNRIEHKPYLLTLLAWFLLIRNTISSAEIMQLFGLKTHKAARSIAERLPLEKIGSRKSSAYKADYEALAGSSMVLDAIQTWLKQDRAAKDQYGTRKDHQLAAKDQ
ncbi:Nuclease-related domain protein [Bhargavaea cecembensis DSE10]|uniref:Nuclease-related domain protein n=1 Tax=Bhargavaea cecembensis DSE10 TaxID=1235279 RepID=M7ND67_9BACL|nr:Nuclease-related domain protein [Bhargavaea cecembensis DSE10]